MNCRKCKKPLDGVSLFYGYEWICADCSGYPTDASYCTKGEKIVYCNFKSGFEKDIEKANKYLEKNSVYTVEKIYVKLWKTEIYLEEFPETSFNSCIFDRVVTKKEFDVEEFKRWLQSLIDSCERDDVITREIMLLQDILVRINNGVFNKKEQ